MYPAFVRVRVWTKAQLVRVFGPHWRNSVWACLAALPQVSPYITQYLTSVQVPQKYLNLITLVCGLCCVFSSASSKVDVSVETGGH